MRLLCLGDSNTYGYDPRSYLGERYPSHVRWTDLLAQQTGWEVRNAGMNGLSVSHVRPELLPEADLLIVMLGSNDLLNGAAPDETARRMEDLLLRLLPRFPAILLVAPPPMQRGEWVTEQRLLTDSLRLAGRYRELAQRLKISFRNGGDWNVELTFDGVHFSPAGHRAFAEGLTAALNA